VPSGARVKCQARALGIGDRLGEDCADEGQRGAIVGREALRQRPVRDQSGDGRSTLRLGVMMRAVRVGQESEAGRDRPQRQPERVGRSAGEPAHRSRRDAGEHDAGLPALRQHGTELVCVPNGEQVGHAAAGDPDQVLVEQEAADVGRVRLGIERKVAGAKAGAAERRVEPGEPRGVIA
jgi:hypothetical protein